MGYGHRLKPISVSAPSVYLIVCLLLFVMPLCGCQALNATPTLTVTSPRLTTLQHIGVLKVGTAVTQPFEYRDLTTNALIGFDVDLLTRIAAPLGVTLDWRELTFADLLPQLENGTLDVVIAAMYITPDREALVDFSQPYLDTGLVLVIRVDNTAIQTLSDLSDKRLGVKESSTGEKRAERLRQEENISVQLRRYADTLDSLDDLRLGLLDAVFNDYLNTLQYMQFHPEIRIQGNILEPAGLGIAVKTGDAELLDYINQQLNQQSNDGTINRLFHQWISPENTIHDAFESLITPSR